MIIALLLSLIADLSGPVVGVTDGDTVRVLVSGKEVWVRLAEIDAPERGQPFGARAKESLARRVYLRWVRVEVSGVDRWERPLGTLFIDQENINHWLVREGWAWRYDRYSKSEELLRLQDEARKLKKGLWNDGKPIPPWEFRSAKVQRVR